MDSAVRQDASCTHTFVNIGNAILFAFLTGANGRLQVVTEANVGESASNTRAGLVLLQ